MVHDKENLEKELQNALLHLHDPDYEGSDNLCRLLGCDIAEPGLAVQSRVIQTLKDLNAQPPDPDDAYAQKLYDFLYRRYILQRTQEALAEEMNTSVSSVKRLQREAIHMLLRIFWEAQQSNSSDRSAIQSKDWSEQARRELATLQACEPHATSDVATVVDNLMEIAGVIAARHTFDVKIGYVQPRLTAAVHPNVLRQTLITTLGQIAPHAEGSTLTFYAGLENGQATLTLSCPMVKTPLPTVDEVLEGILVPACIAIEAHFERNCLFLWFKLPAVGQSTVLVVDDNPDMIRFYQRAAEGTNFRIVHVTQGRKVLTGIESYKPDVIVLDVMLPDIDGWDLLMQLREIPDARYIPVVVCSVVREEALALSLGASVVITKPVSPQDFIAALEEALALQAEPYPRS